MRLGDADFSGKTGGCLPDMTSPVGRLIVVSNRLPVVIEAGDQENFGVRPGSGGLVSALNPALQHRGGLWVGWPGMPASPLVQSALKNVSEQTAIGLIAVELSAEEIDKYYVGFSNEVLWFLFHDFISLCNFEPAYWPAYQEVNRKFAAAAVTEAASGDFLWVHDYHLLLAGHELRKLGMTQPIGFFLHIPFPPLDGFVKLPWRRELLEGLLAYDCIGFQTARDLRNFVNCVRRFFPGTRFTEQSGLVHIRTAERQLRAGAFPIGVDFDGISKSARSAEVASRMHQIRENFGTHRVILGLDRLDWTKGLIRRLKSFAIALEEHPELREQVILVQVIVPSRLDVSRYRELKEQLERLISEINGRFATPGWTPVQYMFRHLDAVELYAYYRMADVALVTPLKDGMNLVCKEYCASKFDEPGVLILSEFAGAAAQLHQDALIVNPFDLRGVAAAIHRACTMDPAEQRERMRRLRKIIRRSDVHSWVDEFLRTAIAKTVKDFHPAREYQPYADPMRPSAESGDNRL